MKIRFGDARLYRVFNSYRLLQAEYGAGLAASISVRMGVLAAAPMLAAVPSRPPIGLRAEQEGFTVHLVGTRRLRFRASAEEGAAAPVDPAAIASVDIIGVEL